MNYPVTKFLKRYRLTMAQYHDFKTMEMEMSVRDSIVEYMDKMDMTVDELADKVNLDSEMLVDMLSGKHSIPLRAIGAVSRALGVDIITIARPWLHIQITEVVNSRFVKHTSDEERGES
jgi:hypothetical protein